GADAVQERREGLERGAGISELELLGLAAQPRGCTSARGEARGSEAESGDDLERALRHLTGSTGRQCTGFQPRLELRSALRRRTLPWNEQRQQASYRCGVRLRNEHSPYELRFSVPSGRDPASGCEDGARGGTSRARLSNATPGSVPETMSRSTPRHKPKKSSSAAPRCHSWRMVCEAVSRGTPRVMRSERTTSGIVTDFSRRIWVRCASSARVTPTLRAEAAAFNSSGVAAA